MNKEERIPQIGDICKFWDDDSSSYAVGKLFIMDVGIENPYHCENVGSFENCEVYEEPQAQEFNEQEYLDKCAISVLPTVLDNYGEGRKVSELASASYEIAQAMLEERKRVFKN